MRWASRSVRDGWASRRPSGLRATSASTPGAVSLLALVNDHAHAVEFVIDRALWVADAIQAHPLVNTATVILSHVNLERFLAATGHVPRVIDVPGAHRRGNVNVNVEPDPDLTPDPDAAAMKFDEFARDGESEPGALDLFRR